MKELVDGEELPRATLLSQLLTNARLFRNSTEYLARLDFIVLMGNMAPYNAVLLPMKSTCGPKKAWAYDAPWRSTVSCSSITHSIQL